MKIGEYSNKELYEALVKLEPQYYYGSIGDPKETREYALNLFKSISVLLAKYNIIFHPESYHKSKTKDKIELYKSSFMRSGKFKVKTSDWIIIWKEKNLK